MKEEEAEWCIWFSLVHTFIGSVGVCGGIYAGTHSLKPPLQVSFLVLEPLGEDARLVSQAPVMNSQG